MEAGACRAVLLGYGRPSNDSIDGFDFACSGQVDAVSIDLPVAQNMIKNGYSDATIIKETPTGEQYGIAVNKDNPELTKALNEALATIKANGTYDQIYDKWFKVA